MRFALPALVLCLIPCTGILAQQPAAARADSQVLVPSDSTRTWQYPYQVSRARRELIVTVLRAFHDSCDVRDLVRQLGAPAQIEELYQRSQCLWCPVKRSCRVGQHLVRIQPKPVISARQKSTGETQRILALELKQHLF